MAWREFSPKTTERYEKRLKSLPRACEMGLDYSHRSDGGRNRDPNGHLSRKRGRHHRHHSASLAYHFGRGRRGPRHGYSNASPFALSAAVTHSMRPYPRCSASLPKCVSKVQALLKLVDHRHPRGTGHAADEVARQHLVYFLPGNGRGGSIRQTSTKPQRRGPPC